ncbi:hypothetical protein D3C80_1276460 [compost metagenome]
MCTELDADFIAYSLERIRNGNAAHWLSFGPIAVHLKQVGVGGVGLPTGLYDGLGLLVQGNVAHFARLRFLDDQIVTRYLFEGEAQKVTDP